MYSYGPILFIKRNLLYKKKMQKELKKISKIISHGYIKRAQNTFKYSYGNTQKPTYIIGKKAH